MYIVAHIAGIHKKTRSLQEIRSHEHVALFLPPYSPMLNPVEGCWAKVKKEVCKTPLQNNEILVDRIKEALMTASVENCRGWIRYSYKFFFWQMYGYGNNINSIIIKKSFPSFRLQKTTPWASKNRPLRSKKTAL